MVELCTGLANSPAANTLLIQVAIQDNLMKAGGAAAQEKSKIKMPISQFINPVQMLLLESLTLKFEKLILANVLKIVLDSHSIIL